MLLFHCHWSHKKNVHRHGKRWFFPPFAFGIRIVKGSDPWNGAVDGNRGIGLETHAGHFILKALIRLLLFSKVAMLAGIREIDNQADTGPCKE